MAPTYPIRPAPWGVALAVVTLAACGGETLTDPNSGRTPRAPSDAGTTGAPTADGGMVSTPTCPPAGAVGTRQGDIVPDLSLFDCDGRPVSSHELCGYDAAYFFVYADW